VKSSALTPTKKYSVSSEISFVRQAANLWFVKHRQYITQCFKDLVVVLDSFPVPVCRFARARFCKLFKGIAAYGKELGNQPFYGFRPHLKINSAGMIQGFEPAAADVHDVRTLPELTEGDNGTDDSLHIKRD
jgi:hypothetical protein